MGLALLGACSGEGVAVTATSASTSTEPSTGPIAIFLAATGPADEAVLEDVAGVLERRFRSLDEPNPVEAVELRTGGVTLTVVEPGARDLVVFIATTPGVFEVRRVIAEGLLPSGASAFNAGAITWNKGDAAACLEGGVGEVALAAETLLPEPFDSSRQYVALCTLEAELGSAHVTHAVATRVQESPRVSPFWSVQVWLTDSGTERLANLTAELANRPVGDIRREFAIVVDGWVILHPQVALSVDPVSGYRGDVIVIPGKLGSTQDEAMRLAAILTAPLPVELRSVSELG